MILDIRTAAAALALAFAATAAEAGDPFSSEVALPEDVLIRVAELWEEGDRYESAIEQIIATAALPDWSGGCGCDAPEETAAEIPPSM